MILTFKGIDSWDRPVYEDQEGRLWKDTNPMEDIEPHLCSACNNEFDGEPDCPFYGDYTFFPFRAVWGHGRQRWKYIEQGGEQNA